MKNRRFLSLPVLITAALALALLMGSVGTATAGGLTRGVVKKIATRIVTTKAPTLTVAHASTADSATHANTADFAERAQAADVIHADTADEATNASTLDGKGAAAYLNAAFTIAIPNQTAAVNFTTWTLPDVPAGDYLATINFSANMSTGANLSCLIQQGSPATTLIWSYAGLFSGFDWVNASRVISVGTGALTFFCAANGSSKFTSPIAGLGPNTLSFLPLDTVISLGTATPRPAGSHADASGGRVPIHIADN